MSQTVKKQTPVRCLTEGGICVALSLALSYLKIPVMSGFGGFGGSIDFVMVPLIVFAVRWGLSWGIGAGLVFGTLKYFLASGTSISWVSIVFDYAVAYAFVGFAGCFKKKYVLLPVWMLNTNYNGKIYTFAMNGQTGKMTGAFPICRKRTAAWFAGICGGVTLLTYLLQMMF
jgi:energy-coupled thiamine transporter ThiT